MALVGHLRHIRGQVMTASRPMLEPITVTLELQPVMSVTPARLDTVVGRTRHPSTNIITTPFAHRRPWTEGPSRTQRVFLWTWSDSRPAARDRAALAR
jgi:hypothetical protein